MSRFPYYPPFPRREELLPPGYSPEQEGLFPQGYYPYDPAALTPQGNQEPGAELPALPLSPEVQDLPPSVSSNFRMSKLTEPRVVDESGNIIEQRRARRPVYRQPAQAVKPDPVRQDVPASVPQAVRQPTGTPVMGPLGPIDSSNLAMTTRPQATGKPFDEEAQKKEKIARLAREMEKRFPRAQWSASRAQLAAENAAMAKAQGYKPKFTPLEAASMEFYPTRPILTSTRLPSERFEQQQRTAIREGLAAQAKARTKPEPMTGLGGAIGAAASVLGSVAQGAVPESLRLPITPSTPGSAGSEFVKGATFGNLDLARMFGPESGPEGDPRGATVGEQVLREMVTPEKIAALAGQITAMIMTGKVVGPRVAAASPAIKNAAIFGAMGALRNPDPEGKMSLAENALERAMGVLRGSVEGGLVGKLAGERPRIVRDVLANVVPPTAFEFGSQMLQGRSPSEALGASSEVALEQALFALGMRPGAPGPEEPRPRMKLRGLDNLPEGVPQPPLEIEPMLGNEPFRRQPPDVARKAAEIKRLSDENMRQLQQIDALAREAEDRALEARGRNVRNEELMPSLFDDPYAYKTQEIPIPEEAARYRTQELLPSSEAQALIDEAAGPRTEELVSPPRPEGPLPEARDVREGRDVRRIWGPDASLIEQAGRARFGENWDFVKRTWPKEDIEAALAEGIERGEELSNPESGVAPDRGPGQGPTQKLVPPRYALADAVADIDNMARGEEGVSRREELALNEQERAVLNEKETRLEAYERGENVDVSDISLDDKDEIARRRRLREGGMAHLLDPVQELTSTGVSKMIRDADQEGAIDAYLKESGAEYYRPLGAGSFNAVIDIGGGKIARIGLGTLQKPPTSELINQPIDMRAFPLKEPYYDPQLGGTAQEIRVEIYPKIEGGDVTREEIGRLAEALEGEDIYFWDRSKGNVGRDAQGRPIVIDAGAVARSGRGISENEVPPPRNVFASEARETRPLQEELLPAPEPIERGVEGPRVEELRPPGEARGSVVADIDPADMSFEEFSAAVQEAVKNEALAGERLNEARRGYYSSLQPEDEGSRLMFSDQMDAASQEIGFWQNRKADLLYGSDKYRRFGAMFDSEGNVDLERTWNAHRDLRDQQAFEGLKAYRAKIDAQGKRSLSKEEAALIGKNYKYVPMDVDEPTVGKEFYHGTGAPVETAGELNPAKFGSSDSLYAIGLYMTDNPTLADTYAPEAEPGQGYELVTPDGKTLGYYETEGEALEHRNLISRDRYIVEDEITGEVLFETNDRQEAEMAADAERAQGVSVNFHEVDAVPEAETFTARQVPTTPEGRVLPVRLRNLKLIDLEKPLSPEIIASLNQAIKDLPDSFYDPNQTGIGGIVGPDAPGKEAIEGLLEWADSGFKVERGTLAGRSPKDVIPRILQRLGYDGFRHEGGQRMGGYGAHNVVVLFPDFKGEGTLYPQKFRLPGETGQLRIEELSSPDLGRTVETPSTMDMRSGQTEELVPPSRDFAPDLGRTVETPESGAMPRPGELVPLMQREGAWEKPERYQGEELAPPVLDAGKIKARTGVKLEDFERIASEPYKNPVWREGQGMVDEEWPGYYNEEHASDFAALTQQEFLAIADKHRPAYSGPKVSGEDYSRGAFEMAPDAVRQGETGPEQVLGRVFDAQQHAFWVANEYWKWRNGDGPPVPSEILDAPLEIPITIDAGKKKGAPSVKVGTLREYVATMEARAQEALDRAAFEAKTPSSAVKQYQGNINLLLRMFGEGKREKLPGQASSKAPELTPSPTVKALSEGEAAAMAKGFGMTMEEYRAFEAEQLRPDKKSSALSGVLEQQAAEAGIPVEIFGKLSPEKQLAALDAAYDRKLNKMTTAELMEASSKKGTTEYDELSQESKDAVRQADEDYLDAQEIEADARIERTASADEAESVAALGELAADGNPAAKAALEALQTEDVPKAPEIRLGQQVFAVNEEGALVAVGKAVSFGDEGVIIKKADGSRVEFSLDRVRPQGQGAQPANLGELTPLYGGFGPPVTAQQIATWIGQGVDQVKAFIDAANTIRIGTSGRRTEQLIKLMPTLYGREAADQAFRAFQRIKSDLPAAFNRVDESYVGLRNSLKATYGKAKAKAVSAQFWHGLQSFNDFYIGPDKRLYLDWNKTGIAYDVVNVKTKPKEAQIDAIRRTINDKKIKLPDGTIGTDADFNAISLGDGRYRLFKKFKAGEREDAVARMLTGDENATWAELETAANPNGKYKADPKLIEIAQHFNDLRQRYSVEHGFVDDAGRPQIEGYIHHFAARNFFGAFGKMFQVAKAAPTKMRTGRSFQQKTVEMDGFESMRRMEKEFVKAKLVGQYKTDLVALLGATAKEIGPEAAKLADEGKGQYVSIKREWTDAGKTINRLASNPEGLMKEVGIDPKRAKRLGFAMQRSGVFMPRVAAEMLGELIDPKGSRIISAAANKMPQFARHLDYGYALVRDTMDWYMLSLLTQGKTAMRDLVTTGAFMFPMKMAGDFLKGTKRTVWNRDPNAFVPFKQDVLAVGRAASRDLGGAYSPLSSLGTDVPSYLAETELPGSLYRDPLRNESSLPSLFEAPITKIMKLKNLADTAGKRLIYDAAYMAEAELQARRAGFEVGSDQYKELLDRMRKNPQDFPEIRASAKAKADAFAFGGEDLNPTIDRFTSGILGKLTLGLFSKFTAKTFQVLFDHSPIPLSQKTVRQLMLPTEASKIAIEGRPMSEIQRSAARTANDAFKAQMGQIKSDAYKDAFAQFGKRTPANEAQWSKAYRDAYDRRKAAAKDPVFKAEVDRLTSRRQNELAARNRLEKEDAIIRTALGWVGLAGTFALSKYAGLTAVPSEDESGKAYPEKFNEAFTVRTPFGKFNVKGITPLPEAIGVFDMTAKPLFQWMASKLRDPSINMPRLADAIDLPGRALSPLEYIPQAFSGGPATQLLAGIFDQERRGPNSKVETKLEKAGRAVGDILSAPLKGITQPVREIIDPYQRETEGTGFFDTMGKTIAAGTPGASLMLKKRTDPQTGEELRVGETSGIQRGIEELLPSPLARIAAPAARSFAPTDIKNIPEEQKALYGSPSGRVQEPGKLDIEQAEEYLGRKLPDAEREEYKQALEEAFVPEQKKRYRAQAFVLDPENDLDPRIFSEYERDALEDLRGAYERAEDEKSRDAIVARAGEMMSRRAETVATKSEELYPGIDVPFDPKDPASIAHNARVKAGAILVLERMKKNQYWSKLQNIEKRDALRAAAGEIAAMFGAERDMDDEARNEAISDMSEFLQSEELEDMLEEIIISTAERNRGR